MITLKKLKLFISNISKNFSDVLMKFRKFRNFHQSSFLPISCFSDGTFFPSRGFSFTVRRHLGKFLIMTLLARRVAVFGPFIALPAWFICRICMHVIDHGWLLGFADEVSEMFFGCGFRRQFKDPHSTRCEAVSVSPAPASSSQDPSLHLDNDVGSWLLHNRLCNYYWRRIISTLEEI